jgi:hypothetical protein
VPGDVGPESDNGPYVASNIALMLPIVTEGTARPPDRDAEVSRGHSRFVVGEARHLLRVTS